MIAKLLKKWAEYRSRPRLRVNDWSGLTREERLHIKAMMLGCCPGLPRDADGKMRIEVSDKDSEEESGTDD